MAVPGHDERDREFAHIYGLPIIQSIEASVPFDAGKWKKEYGDEGISIALNIPSEQARKHLTEKAEKEGF